MELAGLETKENYRIEELTIGEKKLLLLITLIVDTSKQYLLQNLFQNMQVSEVKCATELLIEMSTYMDIILISPSTYGYEICDKTIYWPDNNTIDNREFHISRNKIKEMCIMPTFIMKEIIKVIKENETTDIAIPLWNVVPGEYEEYAYQVLNSNADKEKFNYPYISHRPFRYGDVYWIMEHQLQELEINGSRCFEEAHFIPDEAIIHLAMVVLYLTGDKTVNPATVAEYAESAGYSIPDSGSSWTLISEGCEHYGVHATEVPMDEDRIKAKLDEGCPIIVNVGPGDFTDSGHFMTLTGYDSEGFTINDSNSRTNSEKHWTYAQMYGQVRNLWAMYI